MRARFCAVFVDDMYSCSDVLYDDFAADTDVVLWCTAYFEEVLAIFELPPKSELSVNYPRGLGFYARFAKALFLGVSAVSTRMTGGYFAFIYRCILAGVGGAFVLGCD